MVTPEQQAKADRWLIDYLMGAIQTERQQKEALLFVTYDPITNKTTIKRVTFEEIKNGNSNFNKKRKKGNSPLF